MKYTNLNELLNKHAQLRAEMKDLEDNIKKILAGYVESDAERNERFSKTLEIAIESLKNQTGSRSC